MQYTNTNLLFLCEINLKIATSKKLYNINIICFCETHSYDDVTQDIF